MTIMVFTDLLILNHFDPTVQFCPTASILQVLSCVQTKRTAGPLRASGPESGRTN